MQKCPIHGFFSDQNIMRLAEQLRNGKLTSIQITLASLETIQQFNSQVNAFCFVDRDFAIKQAEHADNLFAQGIDHGLLQGIPIAIKDNIKTANMPTTMGSAFYKDYIPTENADCVELLKQAGAIIIGKTNTHEFAYGPTGDCSFFGATKNPWNTKKISGGSSCGSAVAVATGMVPIAIGTDTGGSIRIPASLTGIIGFKPSYRSFSTLGVFPLSQTLDHLGILAKNVEDIKIVFDILKNPSLNTQSTNDQEVKPKAAWIAIEQITHQFDSSHYQNIKEKAFELFGHHLENIAIDLSSIFSEISNCFTAIQNAEAYRIHQKNIETNPELFQTEVLERLYNAKHTSGWAYLEAMSLREKFQFTLSEVFQRYEFLIMPTIAIPTTDLDQRYIYCDNHQINVRNALLSLTSPWNVLGFPACNIPIMLSNDNMPLGLQIVANNNDDAKLIEFMQLLNTDMC